MERREKLWLIFLILVAVAVNAITLTPLVPWQEWLLWSSPQPTQSVDIEFEDYQIRLPQNPVHVRAGEFVRFTATSRDVTYGLGVFRPDGTLVFQMQVPPGRPNTIVWRFDQAGTYDIRSTEYSGPKHSEMLLPQALVVEPAEVTQ